MKVLIIGSGGREHAIAYTLSKSSKVKEIHAIPGNPGISKLGTCHSGSVEDLDFILQFVKDYKKYDIFSPMIIVLLVIIYLISSQIALSFASSTISLM